MIDIDISKIIEDLGKKDTEELLKIAFTEPGDYIKEVSDSAKKELVKKNKIGTLFVLLSALDYLHRYLCGTMK